MPPVFEMAADEKPEIQTDPVPQEPVSDHTREKIPIQENVD